MSSFPKNTLLSIASLGKLVLLTRFFNCVKSNSPKKLKLLVLGNGPSLNQTLAESQNLFSDFDLMAVNNLSQTDRFIELKPKWYILHAFIYYVPDSQLSPAYQKMKADTILAILEKTNWPMEILVPFPAKKNLDFINTWKKNTNIKLVFYNQTPLEGFSFLTAYFFKKRWGMPRPHNVLVPAIMNGIWLNYKEIYLVGADHSWLAEITVTHANEALVNQKHFYDENESKAMTMQDYQVRPRRLHEMIHKFYLSFKGYWEILPFANKQKVRIYNASKVSMIDAFERKSLS